MGDTNLQLGPNDWRLILRFADGHTEERWSTGGWHERFMLGLGERTHVSAELVPARFTLVGFNSDKRVAVYREEAKRHG